MVARFLARSNQMAQSFTSWIKVSWIFHASFDLPLKKSRGIMTVAAPWTGREHASRRCVTSCLIYLMIRTMLRSLHFQILHVYIPSMFWRDHVPLIYFSSVVNTCDYTRQEVVGAVECQWLCYSTSAKNPATRAGAVGELKGFRRRSPAAADGNELNMSGCLGTGASL